MKIRQLLLILMLFCGAAFAQDLPMIAVYVTGDVPENEKSALGTRMLASLVNSGRYRGIERSGAFLAEIAREQETQRSGAIDDSHISELGKQFGVKFVCIAAITPAFGSFQVSARVVDVETAEVVHIGESHSPLTTMEELTQASDGVVAAMFGDRAASKPEPPPAAEDVPVADVPSEEIITAVDVIEPVPMQPAAVPMPVSVPGVAPLKKSTYWAVGLDVLGVGMLAYGFLEEQNVKSRIDEKKLDKARKAERNRNAAYVTGTVALLGGISIHIFF